MDPHLNLPDLLEDLEVNIDELTTTLTPLLPPASLSKTSTTLPLLSKAALYIHTAYAIESLLYSALLTSGIPAKTHPITPELLRLKQYFGKVKHAEEYHTRLAEKENRARLDVAAAQRFIKHGLSGNERYDEMRRERVEREREGALEKARAIVNKKFVDEEGEGRGEKRGVESEEGEGTPGKKVKVDGEGEGEVEPAKKKRGRPAKKDKAVANTLQKVSEEATPTRATRSSAPKTRSEAFEALAGGSSASTTKAKGKGKGRGKAK